MNVRPALLLLTAFLLAACGDAKKEYADHFLKVNQEFERLAEEHVQSDTTDYGSLPPAEREIAALEKMTTEIERLVGPNEGLRNRLAEVKAMAGQ